MDYRIFHAVNSFAGHVDGIDDGFEIVAKYAPFLLIGLLAVLWFLPGPRQKRDARQWSCLTAVGAATLGLAIAQLIGLMWDRPRPFMAHHAILLIPHSADGSFPSDHAIVAFAVAVSILMADRKLGLVAVAIAGAMSFARVYVGVHYVSDVVAGAAIGSVCALGIYQMRDRVSPLIDPPLRFLQRLHLS